MTTGKVQRTAERMTAEQKELFFELVAKFGILGLIRELCNYASVRASTEKRDRRHWEITSEVMNDIYKQVERLIEQYNSGAYEVKK